MLSKRIFPLLSVCYGINRLKEKGTGSLWAVNISETISNVIDYFLRPKQNLSLPLAASGTKNFPPNIPFAPCFLILQKKKNIKIQAVLFTRAVWDTQACVHGSSHNVCE